MRYRIPDDHKLLSLVWHGGNVRISVGNAGHSTVAFPDIAVCGELICDSRVTQTFAIPVSVFASRCVTL